MDPDGLTQLIYTIITFAGAVLSIVLAWCVGSLCANDTEKEQQLSLGFSTRICGASIGFLLSFAAAFYSVLQIIPQGISPLYIIALCLVYIVLYTFAFSFGGLHGKDDPENFALFRPIGFLFSLLPVLLFKSLNVKVHEDVTEEDFLNLVDDVAEDDVIDEHQKEMITNIVEFDEVCAREIMTHRTELISVPNTAVVSEIIQIINKNGVSRMPVYGKNIDEIVGMLYVKDLLLMWENDDVDNKSVTEFMRKDIMFVPEARPARDLLVDFRTKHTQVAIVVDEYGGTSGIVTMEDILEEIVGNIQDEFDDETEEFVTLEDGKILAGGFADLEDLFDCFNMVMPETDADTVGGLLADMLGRIPMQGEKNSVEFGDIKFTVKEVGERHIESVLCEKLIFEKDEEKE